MPPQEHPGPRRSERRRRKSGTYAFIVVVLLALGAAYAWYAWANPTDERENSVSAREERTSEDAEESADIIARVGELIMLPEGEEPTIATVTDPEKLRDQVFFANAKTGDIVLIYTQAQKAYLYDPTANILIEVAPLSVQLP